MNYIGNPKTKDSGILCCIPQEESCPVGCADCFFTEGRSYLSPLKENLPNMPNSVYVNANGFIIRVNDGNDSNNERDLVIDRTNVYKDRFFNTSMPKKLSSFPAPVVLTLNPGKMTDTSWHKLKTIPKNLMFVRFRTNLWNLDNLKEAVGYYTSHNIPVCITFMAYYNENIPEEYKNQYIYKKRTLNNYWVLNPMSWASIPEMFSGNNLVYTCGKDSRTHSCQRCGMCVREYMNTKVRLMPRSI